ncbi:beta and beta-prime subunits of DNA dependent RNA-polymerase [Auriculariales sp. MPI-PUGE-AT-0066]|nr:beta and beta-prime subunits of DNA dependent RNA-polymerase [Auriculariales sp. MPI-PUGE-AT-0066]
MNIAHSLPSSVGSISFYSLSPGEIRRISVKQIVNPVLLDDLNRPNPGGLYDPALGPSGIKDMQVTCATCRLQSFECPGHFGHIELPAPVFHPLFINNIYGLIRGTCMFCHRFKMSRETLCKYAAKLRLLEYGLLHAAQDVDDLHRHVRTKGVVDIDDDDRADESIDQFVVRINIFVNVHLFRASGSKRDDYKIGLCYQARRQLIQDFLKAILRNKCENSDCGAQGFTFRKEGARRIVEYDLSIKHRKQHAAAGKKRPNVLRTDDPVQAADEDDEDEMDEDDDGESTHSFDNDTAEKPVDEHPENEQELPRAADGRIKTSRGRNERVISAEECRAHLRRLFANEVDICALVFGRHGAHAPLSADGRSAAPASADAFFLEVLPVSPTRFRPPVEMGDQMFEHPQNELLAKILNTSYRLRDITRSLHEKQAEDAKTKNVQSMLETLFRLQDEVNSFIDSTKNPQPSRKGKLPPPGIKQLLEKKEGLFRKHMMGKRVNYAARSVISPDVNIDTNEIGVPPVFARKLTYPEPVTSHNVIEMQRLVRNGTTIYPGASMVEFEDGTQHSLANTTIEQRTAIANQLMKPLDAARLGPPLRGLQAHNSALNKKVYRHLRDGDILILNRQPTLHKPSMMAHKARVLKGEKTIRMHYANCNSYNADFDGDEMNIHFVQNEIARSEAYHVANTDNQYLVPTSGKPLRGLIQDHIVAALWMTSKQTFFTREEYQQLLYGALRPEEDWMHTGKIETLPPTIWKPKPLWTGKQVISTVLLNITPSNAQGLSLRSKCKIEQDLWASYPKEVWGPTQNEEEVIFLEGHFLCGVLDKSQLGASEFGLVHSVYEVYGPELAGRLLGISSRLLTKYLQTRAFTCRMDDLALTADGNASRVRLLQEASDMGHLATVGSFPALEKLSPEDQNRSLPALLREIMFDDAKMAALDNNVKQHTQKLTASIANECIPHGLLRRFPDNHMQTMTLSGAKGSAVNARQISCGLGQQELEGRRVPIMVSGKTLPSFKAFDTAAIAGGYIASRFLTGVRPQEFYFHCMAGREGLIDTAVKTSRSGYLQRCLIKHLEGIRVHYDHTVRGSDESVLQFLYGGDGLDVTKQKHLLIEPPKPARPGDEINALKKRFGLYEFAIQNLESLINRVRPLNLIQVIGAKKAVRKAMRSALKKPQKNDPVTATYSPARHLGATSERFARDLHQYIEQNPHQMLIYSNNEDTSMNIEPESKFTWNNRADSDAFSKFMLGRYIRSLADPGEAVGLLASQGIGEPSTQMTLNTFHLAGHGAANVTLGIPRLREIIMAASPKPKTPLMQLPLQEAVKLNKIDDFCKSLNKLTLAQVVEDITVTEELIVDNSNQRAKHFVVTIKFYDLDECKKAYAVRSKEIERALTGAFAVQLRKEVMNELKKLAAQWKSLIADIDQGKATRISTGDAMGSDEEMDAPARRDDDDDEMGDGDADTMKRAKKTQEVATYSDDDDDEDEDEDEDERAAAAAANADETEGAAAAEEGAQTPAVGSEAFQDKLQGIATSFTYDKDEALCRFELLLDAQSPKLLLVDILERCCRRTIVRQVQGISTFAKRERVINGKKMQVIECEGSQLQSVWQRTGHVVDMNQIRSNDIYAILKTYGVEMARRAIVDEVSGVFAGYKIDVDRRHLELIADYMTFEGGYKPFNRTGISNNSSPLLKASFETTMSFITDATLHGDFDNLTSPAGSIVLGKPAKTGTGAFDIMMPLNVKADDFADQV